MGLAGLAAVAPAIGQIAGPVLANLFAPEGQQLSSFEGHGAIDPVTMLGNVNTLLERIGQGVTDRAATPVSVPSAYVQQPAVFSGGGLPMPIGVNAQDPALANPSLLNLQGLGQFQNIFQGMKPYSTPGTGTPISGGTPGQDNPFTPPEMNGVPGIEPPGNNGVPGLYPTPGPPGDDTTINRDAPGASFPETTRRRQPAQLVRGADLLAQDTAQPDDMERAVASIKLLMQNLPH